MEKMIENGQISVATSASEKIAKYVNNVHCKGTKATYKVEGHKYPSDTHRCHSVWVDYYYNIDQLKACFRHNNYMDAEKFYVKEGRSWVEFNYDYEAEEKAILDKAEKIENIVEKLKAKKAEDNAQTEDITEAVPAEVITETEKVDEAITEAEAEDNNIYFTYCDIREAIDTIVYSTSSKLQVELHKISDITDIPKSMCFYRQPSGNIGIMFINHCDGNDPLAESYDFTEDYLRENASDIAFELSYRPFNDDPHPQTEDFYFKTEEYKKAEAEAVKALPF